MPLPPFWEEGLQLTSLGAACGREAGLGPVDAGAACMSAALGSETGWSREPSLDLRREVLQAQGCLAEQCRGRAAGNV